MKKNAEINLEKTRTRSHTDKLICGINEVYFSIVEPVRLKISRFNKESLYRKTHDRPLISVYIPTYNRAQILIDRAIPSVLNQTYSNLELIIVGDCCTDETEELVSKIKDSRIRFYNLRQRKRRYPPTAENHWLAGPVVPANQALSLVRGNWIARIDDDELWTRDHLEVLLHFARKHDFEFISSAYDEERNGKKRIIHAENHDGLMLGGTNTWLYRSYLKFFKYNINCWRKKWHRVNDMDFLNRMYRAGVRMGYLNKMTARTLPRPGETTVGKDAYKLTEKEKVKHFEFK